MPREAGAATSAAEEAPAATVDFAFYKTFWELQQAFSSPAKVLGADAWRVTMGRLEEVLKVFGSFEGHEAAHADEPQDAAAAIVASAAADAVAAATPGADEGEEMSEVYFSKFLTSPKLINLQLRDVYFRRHVLVQALIFLQSAGGEHKGVQPLTKTQRDKLEAMEKRAAELLAATPPNGALFAATVQAMLQRERHWTEWKKGGCVAFDKAAAELGGAAAGAKRKAGPGGGRSKKMQLGNSELSKLWNLSGNDLESIVAAAAGSKTAAPSLAEFMAPLMEQLDPDAGIEEEYKLKNDKAYCWKALRLMAKKDVSLLSKVSAPGGSIEAAARAMDDKLKGAKEAPEQAMALDAPGDAPPDAAA